MNAWLETLREQVRTRLDGLSTRERWLTVAGIGLLSVVLVQLAVVSPLQTRLADANTAREDLETDVLRAQALARSIRPLQAELDLVERRIQPGAETNLLTLMESLAQQADIKDRLDSINKKKPSENARYDEERVEIQLRGATLAQTVSFLYRIESAPLYLIVRSIRMKSRSDESQLLDVTLSVSSFTRKT